MLSVHAVPYQFRIAVERLEAGITTSLWMIFYLRMVMQLSGGVKSFITYTADVDFVLLYALNRRLKT